MTTADGKKGGEPDMRQAIQTFGGETLRRWIVETSVGPKVSWARDPEHVQEKVSRAGLEVLNIRPSTSGEMP